MTQYYQGHEPRDEPEPVFEERAPGGEFSRRDFLKLTGFSLAVTALPGCERPANEKLIPYIKQPEGIVAGKAVYYASTCGGCAGGCGILAKCMDGRPIKLEGNPDHPLSTGGLCAVGQAMVLPLYDEKRLKRPRRKEADSDWKTVDAEVRDQLAKIKQAGGQVRFLSGTLNSPTERAAVAGFLAGFPGAKHVQYDALSVSAILDAHEQTHGARLLPAYDFSAKMIVSFDADFLGTWIAPVPFTASYRKGRSLKGSVPRPSRHVQLEARLSLTGSNADERIAVAPSEIGALLTALAVDVAGRAGKSASFSKPSLQADRSRLIGKLAGELWKKRGKSLVVCGTNDLRCQVLVNYINQLLGNYEKTLSVARPSHQCQGDDAALLELVAELEGGKVAALLVHGVNPVYDLPMGEKLGKSLEKLQLMISFSPEADETSDLAGYTCPVHHPLESWRDAEPVAGQLSVSQPTLRPLGKTRSLVESLAAWGGKAKPAYHIMREHWRDVLHKRAVAKGSFDSFWDKALHDGHTAIQPEPSGVKPFDASKVAAAQTAAAGKGKLELVLYPKVAMFAGQHAHNPWLQELADPVSKVVWDNYAAISPATAKSLGLSPGDLVKLGSGKNSLTLPVHIQPGQHDGAVSVALGYGRQGTGRFHNAGPKWIEAKPTVAEGSLVGVAAASLISVAGGRLGYAGLSVDVSRTGGSYALANTQEYDSLTMPKHLAPAGAEKRPFVQETTLGEFVRDRHAGAHHEHPIIDLWKEDYAYTGHHWGMVIDLSACTGCSACVIACQAENNIPVVGKDEVARNREMQWLRIDRYYADHPDGVEVVHQPMMCQQCDHAPCETVCPVLATVHSSEGLNQQVYNRCVGTRYCANNCPYKARRFNWFDYPRNSKLQNLQLNPDVAVRSRGVMEKCTFCVQRIQAAKMVASSEGRKLAEGDVQTACQQSCPADAITFGDTRDSRSVVRKQGADPRRYQVLAELGVEPSIGYLRVVRNRDKRADAEGGKKHHG